MDQSESMVVRCGRCGRAVRVSIARLQKLRTFDCQQCLVAKESRLRAGHGNSEDDLGHVAGSSNVRSGSTKDLTRRERSILLRILLGFSNEEITRAYGLGPTELRELILRGA